MKLYVVQLEYGGNPEEPHVFEREKDADAFFLAQVAEHEIPMKSKWNVDWDNVDDISIRYWLLDLE